MAGYIKLYRDVEQHWIWFDPRHFQWWVQLLFMAAWEPKEMTFGKIKVSVKRGQIATTSRKLMKRFSCCNQTLFDFLQVLEDNDMIVRESNPKMTLITIINYEKYQYDAPINNDIVSPNISQSIERKPHRKMEHVKEEKNIEEKNNINYISPSRARDLEFIEELKSSEDFFEQCAMALKIDITAIKEYLEQFSAEMFLQEKYHTSAADYRQHFFNWIKVQLQKGPGSNNYNSNGTGQTKTKDKYAARRGTNVGNHTADDYKGPF